MAQKSLTLDDVARYPRPGTSIPKRIEFTPDGRSVAYLYSDAHSLVQALWIDDIETGERRQVAGLSSGGASSEKNLSLDVELRRERSRLRELGVTSYAFARHGGATPVLLVPYDDALYVADGDEPLRKLDGTEGALDARLSPNGSRVAFILSDELYTMPTDGGEPPRRLTSGAGNGVTNGVAEYIAQEEMGRSEGYWWSPDGTRIAYVQADSSRIPHYPIVHQGTNNLAVEEHRYPFAGGPNATVRLGVLSTQGADQTAWVDLGTESNIYLARVDWRPDGVLTAQIESRDQRRLRLVAFDENGAATTLLEEHSEPWLNLHSDLRFLGSGAFVWSSEKTGFRHLYLHDRDGRELRALTGGEWIVTGLVAVDEKERVVYFHGTRDGVLERHLYAVSLDGGSPRRVTENAGWHETVIAPDFRLFVDTWSTIDQAPTVTLRRVDDGTLEATLFDNAGESASTLGLRPPELTCFRSRDGVDLQAAVYASDETRDGDERHPLIVSVYGGPHVQSVANRWDLTVDLRAQYLARQGYVVLKVDNRGSANRGHAFEAAIARDMGHIEMDDQIDGVRSIADRPFVDGERVGIYGWSYGGYMTCHAMLRAPEVFKVGMAGAPVTDWDGYDTHYTERYMGSPDDNADGYRASSVLGYAANLQGHLMIIHGMIDENVHFRHSARLIAALTAAGKSYDMVIFPEERHMPRDTEGLTYLEQRLVNYFQSYL